MRSQRVLLLSFIAIALALSYFYFVVPDCLHDRPSCFIDYDRTPALAPFRYRPLQPLIEYAIDPHPTQESILWIDVALQTVLSVITVASLYVWLKRWGNEYQALLGVGLFAVAYIIAFHFYQRALHTSLEVASVTLMLAFMGMNWRRILIGTLLISFASLNRETSLALPVIFMAFYASEWRTMRYRLISLWYMCIWIVITATLHIILGAAPHQLGIVGTLEYNINHLFDSIFTNLVFIPLGIAVVVGYHNAPIQLKRLAVVAGLYVLAIIGGASWRESQRLVLPLLPLVIPLALTDSRSRAVVNAV